MKQETLVEELERGFAAGLLDSTEYAARIIGMYEHLSFEDIEIAFKCSPKLSCIHEFTQWAKHKNFLSVVVTTSPNFFANKFIDHYGFNRVYAADFPFEDGSIIRKNSLLHAEDKPKIAASLCAEFNVSEARCFCVGDSRSDLPLFAQFTRSIGLNASELVNQCVSRTLRSNCALDLVPIIESWCEAN